MGEVGGGLRNLRRGPRNVVENPVNIAVQSVSHHGSVNVVAEKDERLRPAGTWLISNGGETPSPSPLCFLGIGASASNAGL